MIRPAVALCLLPLLLAGCGGEAPVKEPATESQMSAAPEAPKARAPEPLPDVVRVRLDTEEGPITVALDARRAPVTAANFVRYAEEGRFDGTTFYRAAPTKGAAKGTRGFIQGGIRRDYKRMLPPIEHEPTSKTGLKHEAGTISMARTETGAMGEFFITTEKMPAMDSKHGKPVYAAFGKVVEGMYTV